MVFHVAWGKVIEWREVTELSLQGAGREFAIAALVGGAVYICIEAGLLFWATYMVTRRLWMAMGLHMLWNDVQSAVFSGMEESLATLIFCTSAGMVMLLIAMRRGHMLPPPRKRKG